MTECYNALRITDLRKDVLAFLMILSLDVLP